MAGQDIKFSKCGAFSYVWHESSIQKKCFVIKFGRSVKVFFSLIGSKSGYVVSHFEAKKVYINSPNNSRFKNEYNRQVSHMMEDKSSSNASVMGRIINEGNSVSTTPSQAGETQQGVSEQTDLAEVESPGVPLLLQRLLPHKLVSYIASVLAEIKYSLFKNWMIQAFITNFDICMDDFVHANPKDYRSFNDFFTRPLKPGVRPLPLDGRLICSPVDGHISQVGEIEEGRIIQAKKHDYSLTALLGGDHQLADVFNHGLFSTIYLPPTVYHRVHMPAAGTLRKMAYVPGNLYSVNQRTVDGIKGLFARNERVVSVFDTEHGPMAVIMIGAMAVGSMATTWAGDIKKDSSEVVWSCYDGDEAIKLERGDEMGRFKMGSTVIVLFTQDSIRWSEQYAPSVRINMGETLAQPCETGRSPVQTSDTSGQQQEG